MSPTSNTMTSTYHTSTNDENTPPRIQDYDQNMFFYGHSPLDAAMCSQKSTTVRLPLSFPSQGTGWRKTTERQLGAHQSSLWCITAGGCIAAPLALGHCGGRPQRQLPCVAQRELLTRGTKNPSTAATTAEPAEALAAPAERVGLVFRRQTPCAVVGKEGVALRCSWCHGWWARVQVRKRQRRRCPSTCMIPEQQRSAVVDLIDCERRHRGIVLCCIYYIT